MVLLSPAGSLGQMGTLDVPVAVTSPVTIPGCWSSSWLGKPPPPLPSSVCGDNHQPAVRTPSTQSGFLSVVIFLRDSSETQILPRLSPGRKPLPLLCLPLFRFFLDLCLWLVPLLLYR